MTDTPLAETVTGFALFATGLGAIHFNAEIAASVCFITVGLIACVRSYTRTINEL